MDWFNKQRDKLVEAAKELTKSTSQVEWEEAEKFFSEQDTKKESEREVKFRKKATSGGGTKGHSFVRINNVIYKLNNRTHFSYEPHGAESERGAGAFGRAKRGVDKFGNKVVVKVREKQSGADFAPGVEEALKDQGFLLGNVSRTVKKGETGVLKVKEGIVPVAKKVTSKEYVAIKDLGPNNLYEFKQGKNLNENVVLAFHAMLAMQSLHQNYHLLHKDIKPQNFVVNEEGNRLTVLPVDFDFSEITKETTSKLPNRAMAMLKGGQVVGTASYMAPEIRTHGYYSYASDVFALGEMLNNLLGRSRNVPETLRDIATKMKSELIKDRMTLPAAIEGIKTYLVSCLQQDPGNAQIRAAIDAYEDFMKKGTVYQTGSTKFKYTPKAEVPTAEASPTNTGGIFAGFFGSKKPSEAEQKQAQEQTNVNRKDMENFVKIFSNKKVLNDKNEAEILKNLPLSAPNAASILSATMQALQICLDDKKKGVPFEPSINSLLNGLNRLAKDTKKPTEKQTINELKGLILNQMNEIIPGYVEPTPPSSVKLGKKK